MPAPNSTGYAVFVRTISSVIIGICLLISGSIYFFRVGILQTYSPEANNTEDLTLIFCLLTISLFFAASIYRGKFLWFINNGDDGTADEPTP
jgi:hypothetical protein